MSTALGTWGILLLRNIWLLYPLPCVNLHKLKSKPSSGTIRLKTWTLKPFHYNRIAKNNCNIYSNCLQYQNLLNENQHRCLTKGLQMIIVKGWTTLSYSLCCKYAQNAWKATAVLISTHLDFIFYIWIAFTSTFIILFM